MAASATATSSGETKNKAKEQTSERLKTLYPAVNEEECPLPKHWSPKDKYNFIGLSQNNLRVHYKGLDFHDVFSVKSRNKYCNKIH